MGSTRLMREKFDHVHVVCTWELRGFVDPKTWKNTLCRLAFFFSRVDMYRTLYIRPKMTLDFMSKSACLMCFINAGWTQQKCQVGPINFRYVVAFWRHHESLHLDQVRSIDDSQFHIKFLFIY